MTAAAAARDTPERSGTDFEFDVAASAKIWQGTMVALSTSTGYASKGATSTTQVCVGVAQATADNSAGADAAIRVKVRRGVFRFANSASGDLIAKANIGASCYMVDDSTVALTNGSSTRSVAGTIVDVDSTGVWVKF